ncbi:hypothetical protein B0H39_002180 [Clostridium beijerinckii]|uniref:hypothetical protein n=1 Tax=Clostridium beijerinckii TaxID=1520 RepID=UPI001494422B|nr:hypothetical protein [Clostridium beijerinckii]NOW84299.1 hypothetical protein [Clostridium beijerinckii]
MNRKPTEKMINTFYFIKHWVHDSIFFKDDLSEKADKAGYASDIVDIDDFSSVSNFINNYFELAKELKERHETNNESSYGYTKRNEYVDRRPREGQRRYYADDIETYKGGRWVSKVKEDTCRFHDKPSRPSSGLPRTKYDEPERNGHHW